MAEELNLSVDDIASVGDKLSDLKGSLSDGEQEVLGWILARAEAAGDDEVAGFQFKPRAAMGSFSPIQTQVVHSIGVRDFSNNLASGNITVGGSWSW